MLASHGDYSINNGAYPQAADCNIAVAIFMWSAYKLPSFGFQARGFYTNTPGLGAYRGPWAMETLVRETSLDIAARKLGIDPIEIRRRNIVRRADQPRTTPFCIVLEDITPAECLEALLQKLDVAAFREEQAAPRKQGRYLGLGIAAYIEPTAGSSGIAVLASDVAQLRIEPTGKVGEGGCIVGPPTLVNAIADALAPFGALTLDLPLTPTKLLEVIEGRSLAPQAHAAAPSPDAPPPLAATILEPAAFACCRR